MKAEIESKTRAVLRFRRPRLAALSLLGGVAAAAACASLTACPGTATPTVYAPPPGVTLHLGDVLGSLRCGTGPDEVYKYTVVVSHSVDGGPSGAPLYSNVWDCFSDAVFDNLPPAPEGGSTTFFLRIYAFSYAGALAAQASFLGAGDAGADGSVDGAFWCQGGLGPGGTTCPFQDAGTASTLGVSAQWRASCTATEPSGAPISAFCGPLETVGASSDDAAAEAAADATGDAVEASVDSGEAAAPDSSPSDSSMDASTSETGSSDASTEAGD